jgi:hypothetical protein
VEKWLYPSGAAVALILFVATIEALKEPFQI